MGGERRSDGCLEGEEEEEEEKDGLTGPDS